MTDLLWTPQHGLDPAVCARRVLECCAALARFSEIPGTITRTFLSPPMRDVHRVLRDWMDALGMETRIDAIGNLRAVLRGTGAGRLLIGSHLDTVPDAGAYDGVLGVVLAIALLETLDERPPFDIEIIGFSEEEGVRFSVPFLGSRAIVGDFLPEWLNLAATDGTTVRDAIAGFGLDASQIPQAAISTKDALGYLEFHIEQGPVLESLDLPLGIVEAIAGQSRYRLRFEGKANHAGTTPMDLRKDALTAAAQWVTAVERLARATSQLVATVGRLEVTPGAGNVVPGLVEASLDIRHADDSIRKEAVLSLLDTADRIAHSRGLRFHAEPLLDQPAVPCDPSLSNVLRRSVRAAGYEAHSMVSGAGHDAMILAPHVPTAMLFLRSPGGISHHPDESVQASDVAAALETGLCFLQELHKER